MEEECNKIALITDGGCDLPEFIKDKLTVYKLPLKIIYHNQEYDDHQIKLEEIYERFSQEIPKTAMASLSETLKLFQSLKEKGIKQIISVNISSGLSGCYEMIKMASKQFSDLKIEVIDSKSLSVGLGMLVTEANRLIGEGLCLDEVQKRLEDWRERIKLYFSIPNLEYLRQGGRIGLVASTISGMLNIKPIISVNQDGKYYTYDKVRGWRNSLDRLVEIATKISENTKVNIAVMHTAAKEEATMLMEILQKLPNVKEIFVGQIGASLGVHSGPGLVGVAVELLPEGW